MGDEGTDGLSENIRDLFQKKLDEYTAGYDRKAGALNHELRGEREVNASLRDKLNGAQARIGVLEGLLASEKRDSAARLAAERNKPRPTENTAIMFAARQEATVLKEQLEDARNAVEHAERVTWAVKQSAQRMKQTLVVEREARKRIVAQPSRDKPLCVWKEPEPVRAFAEDTSVMWFLADFAAALEACNKAEARGGSRSFALFEFAKQRVDALKLRGGKE